MKRIISLMLAAVMLLTMCGCTQTESTPTTVPEVKYPMVSGTFMQLWAFKNYDEAHMTQHLQYLKDVGIDTAGLVLGIALLTLGKYIRNKKSRGIFSLCHIRHRYLR